jgi:hypothetical protein
MHSFVRKHQQYALTGGLGACQHSTSALAASLRASTVPELWSEMPPRSRPGEHQRRRRLTLLQRKALGDLFLGSYSG